MKLESRQPQNLRQVSRAKPMLLRVSKLILNFESELWTHDAANDIVCNVFYVDKSKSDWTFNTTRIIISWYNSGLLRYTVKCEVNFDTCKIILFLFIIFEVKLLFISFVVAVNKATILYCQNFYHVPLFLIPQFPTSPAGLTFVWNISFFSLNKGPRTGLNSFSLFSTNAFRVSLI